MLTIQQSVALSATLAHALALTDDFGNAVTPTAGLRLSATDYPTCDLRWDASALRADGTAGAWIGNVGNFADQATVLALPTTYLAQTGVVATASGTINLILRGAVWIVSMVPYANARITGQPTAAELSSLLLGAAGGAVELAIDVLPEGNFTVPDNTDVIFRNDSVCASFFTLGIGSDCRIIGNRHKITCSSGLMYLHFLPASKRSVIRELSGDNMGTDRASVEGTRHFISFDCSESSRPEFCEVSECVGYNCFSTVQIKSAYKCKVSKCQAYNNSRSFLNYSAEECVLEKNTSYSSDDASMPRVAFLNISDVQQSYGRGFINNKFSDNSANGWAEEGFSFDSQANMPAKSAFRFASRVVSSAPGVLTVATSPGQAYSGYSLIFQTGALAGKRFEISGFSSATATLKAFDVDYASVIAGDFCTVEVPCYGNIIDTQYCKSNGDASGIVFWGFGYGTKVIAPSLSACVTEVWQQVDNSTLNCTLLPHGVIIKNPTYTNMNAPSDSFALSPLDLYGSVFSQAGTWSGSVSDSSENPSLLYLRFCALEDRGTTHNYFKRVCRIDYKNLKSSDFIALNATPFPTFADTTGMMATEGQVALIVGSPRQDMLAPCSGVASGYVKVSWNGSRFVVPSGELLLCEMGTPATPLYNNVPGVTTMSQLYASTKSIPAYLVPEGQELELCAAIAAIDSSGSTTLLVTIGASPTTEADTNSYPLRYNVASSVNGPGLAPSFKKQVQRLNNIFYGEASGGAIENGNNTQTYPQRLMTSSGTITTSPLKVYVYAMPGLATTRIKVFALYVRSTGNLL